MKIGTKTMTKIAVMTAVLCILGPIVIPIGPVPLSLATFGILLAAYILGPVQGAGAVLLYIAMGAIGLPVFSGFQGGFAKIAGPTGGYLAGYFLLALIAGWFIYKYYDIIIMQFIGMCLGTAVLYALGTAWLAHVTGMSFTEALAAGVLPFIPGDIIKMILAAFIGRAVNKRLKDLE